MLLDRNMKYVVISRWFIPARSPRAFRTHELIAELVRRKREVIGVLPESADIKNIALIDKMLIQEHAPAFSARNEVKSDSIIALLKDKIKKRLRNISLLLLGDGIYNFIYCWRVYQTLSKNIERINCADVIISISFPFYINVAVAMAFRKSVKRPVMIADCGDPFYDNPAYKKAFYLKYLERWTLRKFDFVTIPMEAARKSYNSYSLDEKIKIIPQGVEIIDIPENIYNPNPVPTFCYAGVFYEKIRNPRYFLKFLMTIKDDFRFVVYALNDPFTQMILQEFSLKLGNRLVVRAPIDRTKLIPVMAKMDFVINFNNENDNQRPSKLIDYAMSRRPILSFNSKTFREDVFQSFLRGDYIGREKIDLSQYDIRGVVDKFETIANKMQDIRFN